MCQTNQHPPIRPQRTGAAHCTLDSGPVRVIRLDLSSPNTIKPGPSRSLPKFPSVKLSLTAGGTPAAGGLSLPRCVSGGSWPGNRFANLAARGRAPGVVPAGNSSAAATAEGTQRFQLCSRNSATRRRKVGQIWSTLQVKQPGQLH